MAVAKVLTRSAFQILRMRVRGTWQEKCQEEGGKDGREGGRERCGRGREGGRGGAGSRQVEQLMEHFFFLF